MSAAKSRCPKCNGEMVQGFKAFTQSQELRDKMQQVGVVDKPDVYFLMG